jgi:hypothetical protein
MNDERLSQAWRSAPPPAMPLPDADDYAALLDGRLDPAQREALLARVANDADAALMLQMAMELRAAAEAAVARPAASVTPLRPPARPPWRWVQAIAASLLVAVGAAVWLRPPPQDVLRGNVTPALSDPADGARLTAAPSRLRWAAQPGVTRYQVRLYDARAELIWQSAATAVELSIDEPMRERIVDGQYFWRVEWAGAEGAGLGPYRFEVGR